MFSGRPHRHYSFGPILAIALVFAATGAAAVDPLAPQADTQPPSVPQGMAFAGKTQKTVSLVWRHSTDDVKVVGYRLFRNNVRVAVVTGTRYVYRGLACGKRYSFALEAADAAGNVSNRAEATGWITTNRCTAVAAKPKPAPKPKPKPKPAPGPKAPPNGTANLWVDVNGGSCARLATPGAYNDVRACSWNQAYQAAQTGDFVLIRGGNYGNVRIGPNKPSINAPGVSFRPATGEQVIVRDLENGINDGADGGNNIRFLGPVTARTFRSDDTSNILVSGWRVDCGGCDGEQIFHLEDAQNSTVRDSNIGNNKNNSLIWISGSGITFDHNVIHDAGLPDGSSAHTECMFAWRVTNLTLRRNHFYHCAVMDVFITGGDVSTGGLVENNVFEKPWENTGRISNGHAFHFRNGGNPSPDPSNWEFRYNTFVGGLSISPDENPVGSGGLRVTGNLFLSSNPCGLRNTTYSYNAFAGGGCGSNNVVGSTSAFLLGFVSRGDPGNFALLASSVLRDKGNPANFPAVDRSGSKRPIGGVPDIGAMEFR
jgi:chitodextrinase